MFLWGASPHDVASMRGAAPPVASGGEFRQHLAPTLPPLGEFQTPARRTSLPQSHRSSVDVARCECSAVDVARRCCSAVDVARRCCSAVDVAWLCCSAVDVAWLCCSAVDVARRLRSVVDVTWDPLALLSGPLLPPLVSLLLLTPPTCLALTLVPPTCLALVLASPHSPCFCFLLPPKCLALLLAPPTGLSMFLAPPQDPSLDQTFWGGLRGVNKAYGEKYTISTVKHGGGSHVLGLCERSCAWDALGCSYMTMIQSEKWKPCIPFTVTSVGLGIVLFG
ncbi:hypothetical protein QTP70_000450 [Hemibagrus guttatus]|uniref:Uncharacterized protein n=1 Tax=Hemibagrus guttatus TaxID=175788 RepID=A0AAE0UYX5_9TELE|nr:hypothetical protein QTP70_000450 [Hemibagrus guttatus]